MPKSYNSIKAGWKNPNATENGINRHSKSYKEIKASDYDFGVNNDYIKTFANESQGLFKNINKDIEDINYNNASAKYEQKQNELRDIRHKADTIRAYFNANKKNLDSNSYNSTIKYLNDLDSSSENLLKGYRDSVDFMKQFSNESEYNEWKAYNKYKNIDLSDRKKIAEYRNAAETEEERSYLYWKGLETFSEDELKQREKELKLTNDYESAQDIHTAYLYKKKDRLSNIPLYVNGAETNAYQALEDAYNLENEASAQYAELEKLGKVHAGHTTEEFKKKQKEYTETQEKLKALNEIIKENNLVEEKNALAVLFGDYSKVGRTSFTSRLGSAGDFLIDYYLTSSGSYQRAEAALRSIHSSNPDYVPTRDEVLDYLGIGRNNPITAFHKQENARLAYETTIAEENAKAANLDTKYGDIWAGAVSELPNAAFSFAYGALNNAAQKGVDLVASSAYNNSSVLGKAGITMRNMLKNPQYWTSFFEEVGGNYEEALENGASRDVAVVTATITSLINSIIEIGTDGMSGIQGLPQELLSGNKSVIASWAESMLEEGKEEVLQGIVQNLIAKVSYDHDKPLVGVNGEAVIDPYRALEEFGMGAAVGGILGGGQILGTAALSGGINALSNSELRKYGENIRKTEGAAEQLIQFAQAHPEYKATANILSKINTDNVSDVQLGKIYASVWSDVENTVKSLKSDSEKAQYLEALYINNGNSPIIASAAVGIATNLDNQKAERTKAASKKYAEKSQAVRNAVFSEKATDSDIKNILLDNDTIEEFEDITGKKIQGKTTAEQESIVRDFLETRDIARLPYKENANIAVRNFDTGEDVVIRGIKKKSNSEVIFETSAGDMSYGDISMPSSLATVIKDATSKYGIDTANSFLRHLTDTDMNPAQYAANFSAIYNIGRATDISFEEVSKEFPSAVKNMGESAARAAFNRGRADIVTQKQETPTVTTETRGRYINESDSEAPFSPEVYESVAKKTGIDIHRIEEESPVRGHFNVNMLSMLINADNSNEFSTLVHELGEYGEALNYEGMKQVQDNVLKWYLKQNENGISLDNYIKQYQAAYEQKTKSSVSYEEAVKEITNDAIAGLFNTDGGIKQFVTWVHSESGLSVPEQKTLLQKIKDILNAIALKLREWVKGKDFTGSESMLLEMEANEAAKLRSQFLKAIDEATANLQTIKNTDTENVSADVDYSINVDYVNQLDEWNKNGRDSEDSFTLGSTGNVLQGLGAIESDIFIRGEKINKILADHKEITLDEIKKIPEMLEDPVLIAKSQNAGRGAKQNTRLLIYGSVNAKDGRPAMVVFDLRPVENNFVIDDMQKVNSMYVKDNAENILSKSEVLYADKKRTAKLLRTIGFQMPIELQESGYIGSISYNKQNVNTSGKNFSEVFSIGGNNSKIQEKFSLKLPVEETKDLIAVHNLSQEELLKTLKLGGFPMPSVAIVKAQNGHNEFGDISVIFDKNTIDPSKSGNKVYGGDAWTPSFPTIEYKPRESVQQKIRDKYYDLAKRIGYDNAKPLYDYVYDMESKLAAGEDVLLTTLYSDTDMMNLYRQDIGEKKIDTVKKTVETKMSDADIERSQFILEKLPDLISELDNATGSPFIKAKNLVDNNLEKIQNVFMELYKQYGFSNKQIENAINGTTKSDYVNFIRDARKYRANNGVTVREETDIPATKEKIIAETDQNAYKKWVNGLFKGIEEKQGLRNNKDPYSPSGNARSFEALHYEVNLENVVRAMKEESPIGNSFFSFSGIWGAAAKQYNSISEIKEDSSRLKTITQEEFDTIREGFGERLNEIAASIIDTGISNPFIALDTAMSQIVDAINTSRTKSGMFRALQQYNPKATEMTVQDIIDLVNDISNMPTEYFEAKPRRAVGLDEIRAILIPSNASEDLKTALSDYNTVEYEAENTEDRISKLNSLNDLKFSLAVDSKKKSSYNEFETNAMQWANATERTDGEMRTLYNPKTDEWCLIVAGREYDGGYGVLNYFKDYDNAYNYVKEYTNGSGQEFSDVSNRFTDRQNGDNSSRYGRNTDGVRDNGKNAETQRLVGREPERGGTADTQRGGSNSDGRNVNYSISVDDVSDTRADIVSNKKYQKLVEDLKRKYQYAKEEIYKTKGKKIDRVAIKSTIKDIARFYNSNIDVETFTDRLTDIYNRMAKDKNLTPDSYKYEIEALARDIIDESKRFTEVSEHSKNILRDIRVNAIYFSKADQQEAAYIADSFKNYRNNLMGSVIIATKDTYAMDVNSWAEQMISKYPELRMFFPDGTITSGDVVAALPDIIDSLRNTYQADMEGLDYESEVEMTTLELLDSFAEMPRRQTFADKKESELKQRIKEVRAEEKEKFEKRVEKVIEKERAAKKESKQKVYDKKNEQLARQKAFYQERAKRNAEARRESDERKRLVPRIYKNVKKMTEMLNKPTNNAHIPEVLKTTVGGVLSQIELLENGRDYSTLSVRDKTLYTELEKMKSKIASIEKAQMGKEDKDGNIDYDKSDFELDLPDGFSNEVDNLAKRVQAYIQQDEHFTLHTMSNEDLASLDYILTIMKHSVSQINRMYENARYSHIEELGTTTINDITSYGNQKKFTDNTVGGFFKWKNATPVYAFERFGEAGKSVFKEIANGWSKLARNAQSVIDFSEKTWTPKEYNAWKEEVHEVRLHDGKTVKMNTPQIMSLYLLNQREQARKHIYGGGVVFIDGGKGKNGIRTNMTIDDVSKITSKLSKRQIEVANAIQNQMSTVGSDWGNEISMTRFGYKFFTEPHYFPIVVDENAKNINQSNLMKSNDIFRLLNMGATKGVNEKANAPIDVFDAFDVFADHMSDMAKYNALALPILDTIKWINYKTRIPLSEGGFKMESVREAMDTAYGKDAQKYVIRFLKDLNGVKEGGSDFDSFAGRMLSNVKVAKVGANLRVALLQPTSYARAGYVLSAKSLAMGLNAAVRDGKKLYQEALNKSGLALWKDQGFYDTNINRSMRSMIKNDAGIIDTIKEKSMILAEWGDKATWTALWGACRWEVLHQNPDIKLNSQEFYTKVTDLFDEVILKTQVMDSTITRSELMRDSSFAAKTITAFGSESAVSYNMLMNGLSEFSRLKGQGASKAVLLQSLKHSSRSLVSYILTNAISALAESLFDWERDEDKDEKFGKTWWDNFVLNNSTLLKIPLVKEVVGQLYANYLGLGYSSSSETQSEIGDDIMAVARVVQKISKSVSSGKEEITPYGAVYIVSNLVSDVTGIPITPAMREAVSAYNTAVSSMGKDEWIIRKSPVTTSAKVRNAVNKGYDYFASHIKDIIEYKKTEMYYNLLGKDFTEDYARRNSTDEDAKKSIRATLTNIFKAEYVTASSSRRSEIERMMRASGVYDDVSKTVNDWLNKYAETEKYKR